MSKEQQFDVLEMETALARVGGDLDLLKEIASAFLDECPAMLAQIKQAVDAGDHKALEYSAHSMKGSVANFGARDSFDAAYNLEMMGRQQRSDGVESELAALSKAVERLESDLVRLAEP